MSDTDTWRSLDELKSTPEFAEAAQEFPGLENWFDRAGEAIGTGFDRRRFLQLMGASLALAGFAGCRRPNAEILPFARKHEEIVPGLPTFYATSIPRPGSCFPVLVESHEGRPTKIEGNPLHPLSRGATDVWAQASVLDLYDPNRSRSVLHDGQPSSWDEFDQWASGHFDKLLKDRGKGLAFLVEPIPSPAMRMLREHQKKVAPEAIWCEYSPLDNENERAGTAIAFGLPLSVKHRFDLAKVIVSLDADPFGVDPEMVRHTRDFAAGRRAEPMNRLYVVETTVTVTGMNADHRLALAPSRIGEYAIALLKTLRRETAQIEGIPATWLNTVADDLKKNAGKSIVITGPQQPAEVHAIVHQINETLNNNGATVEFRSIGNDPVIPRAKLAGAGTIVAVGDVPMPQAAMVIKLGPTADAASWHLPMAHFLESWGDAETADGTYSPVQPLIAPLHGGRSPIEVIARLLQFDLTDGHQIVRRSYQGRSGKSDEQSFRRWLHEGVLKDSSRPLQRPKIDTAAIAKAIAERKPSSPSGDRLEINRMPDYARLDGRFTGNGWLQELPDPVSKLTWGTAALIGPGTAERLKIATGDVVKLGSSELPALVLPGHAEGCVSVPVSADAAFPFVSVEKAGRRANLAITQDHGRMDGRDLVRILDVNQKQPHRDDHDHDPRHGKIPLDLAIPPKFEGKNQWGMVIDLTACTGCSACVVACQAENNIPIVGKDEVMRGREMQWIRMDRYFIGEGGDPSGFVSQPVMCVHCESAPCEPVCPVNASVHSDEGLNLQVYNRCIGTRYCSNNCPYKARRFNWFDYQQRPLDELRLGPLAAAGMAETLKMQKNPDVTVRMRGVMEKCTYCVQRIERARIGAKLNSDGTLADGDVTPACAQACPASAIVFGNLNDPTSRVAKLKKDDDDYLLLGELNTKPRTSYRVRRRNLNAAMKG